MSAPTLDLERRATGIGASEIAAIAGLSPWTTPLDVYMRKVGLTGESPDSESAEWGRRLEAVVAEKYSDVTGLALVGDGVTTVEHPERPWMLCTPDRMTVDGLRLVEIKTAKERQAFAWGPSGTDEVPEYYLLQVAWQMAVCDVAVADVAVLLGGWDFRMYTIARDPELEGELVELGERFWFDHVTPQIPPDPTDADSLGRYLTARYPRERAPLMAATPAAEEIAFRLRDVRELLEEAEAEKHRLETALKAIIGDAEGIEGHFGKITWRCAKPTRTTDYKAIVAKLAPPAELVAAFTTTKPGARRFLPQFIQET